MMLVQLLAAGDASLCAMIKFSGALTFKTCQKKKQIIDSINFIQRK